MKNALKLKSVQLILTGLILGLTLIFISSINYTGLPPDAFIATAMMLGTLIMGLLFLILDQRSLMMVSFSSCAAICMMIKDQPDRPLDMTNIAPNKAIKIAHFNLDESSSLDFQIDWLTQKAQSDILSFQNIKYEDAEVLHQSLETFGYKYSHVIEETDQANGIAIFSVYPISFAQRSQHFGCSNIIGKLELPFQGVNSKELYFVSTYIDHHSGYSYQEEALLKQELNYLANQFNQIKTPLIVFSEYNSTSMSNEMAHFQQNACLTDSQQEINAKPRLRYYDTKDHSANHIYYSNDLKCVSFETINNATLPYSGLVGTYEFVEKAAKSNAKHTSQKL